MLKLSAHCSVPIKHLTLKKRRGDSVLIRLWAHCIKLTNDGNFAIQYLLPWQHHSKANQIRGSMKVIINAKFYATKHWTSDKKCIELREWFYAVIHNYPSVSPNFPIICLSCNV